MFQEYNIEEMEDVSIARVEAEAAYNRQDLYPTPLTKYDNTRPSAAPLTEPRPGEIMNRG